MHTKRFSLCRVALFWALGIATCPQAWPQPAPRVQTVALSAGWNAVFLEIDPADPDPSALFAGTPVDLAAAHLQPVTTAQFVSNPNAELLRKSGWNVWYSPDRPDGFLSTLHAIHGQQAYLIHATEAFVWKPSGAALMPGIRWQADAYNLVGFSVSSRSPPTFSQFFAGSPAHRHNRIYRLIDGAWQRVADPSAHSMRSGEAFWVYCQGSSRYPGPLLVEAPTHQGLVLGERPGTLVLRNLTDHPVTPTLESAADAPGSLPLALVVRAVGNPRAPIAEMEIPKPTSHWSQSLPPVEAGAALRVPLAVQREAMTAHVQPSLLRISTDLGTEIWVPVFGVRKDLKRN